MHPALFQSGTVDDMLSLSEQLSRMSIAGIVIFMVLIGVLALNREWIVLGSTYTKEVKDKEFWKAKAEKSEAKIDTYVALKQQADEEIVKKWQAQLEAARSGIHP